MDHCCGSSWGNKKIQPLSLRWYDMVLLGIDCAQNFLVQGELETENVGVALGQSEPKLVESSGLQVDADSTLQQLGPALVATSGRTVVK